MDLGAQAPTLFETKKDPLLTIHVHMLTFPGG